MGVVEFPPGTERRPVDGAGGRLGQWPGPLAAPAAGPAPLEQGILFRTDEGQVGVGAIGDHPQVRGHPGVVRIAPPLPVQTVLRVAEPHEPIGKGQPEGAIRSGGGIGRRVLEQGRDAEGQRLPEASTLAVHGAPDSVGGLVAEGPESSLGIRGHGDQSGIPQIDRAEDVPVVNAGWHQVGAIRSGAHQPGDLAVRADLQVAGKARSAFSFALVQVDELDRPHRLGPDGGEERVQPGARQVHPGGAGQVRPHEPGAVQHGALQPGRHQIGVPQVGVGQVQAAEILALQIRIGQPGARPQFVGLPGPALNRANPGRGRRRWGG